MKSSCYARLSDDEREVISRNVEAAASLRAIARLLHRSPSTISREVRRDQGRTGYRAFGASPRARRQAARRRLGQRKILATPALQRYIHAQLKAKWSPVQVAQRLAALYPADRAMQIAPETIYAYIYVLPRGNLKQLLIAGLRQERAWRRARRPVGTPERRGRIAGMLSIEERPADVAARTVPGHWEGDLVMGKYHRSAIGTLVERTTRYTMLVRLSRADATTVRQAYVRRFRRVPVELRLSLTYDQGREMSEHRQFEVATKMQVYFAHPASPWERGTNENTNGLLRQYFPKGTDFSAIDARQLRRVERSLNGRPRQTLGWHTPEEEFTKLMR
ncbi:MAG: IS30 family transposase [Gemmatimonadales bacterium]